MSERTIRWQIFPRDIIPEVLFGGQQPLSSVGQFSIEPYNIKDSHVAVGYADSRITAGYNPPVLLVLKDESAVETLSWLRTYAPETSPLSQYARVVSSRDWEIFARAQDNVRDSREDIWSSVILGEALAQGETDVELASLPLSRASACFSMAIARAACIHGTDEATKTCADRLRQVEADRRFVRRSVTVSDLTPIWAMAGGQFGTPVSAEETAYLVLDAALSFMHKSARAPLFPSPLRLRDVPGLSSDSIEERVLAFQRLSTELTNAEPRGADNGLPSVLLAAAAFLVGRSTTHEFLLHRVSKRFPAALAWYGLIAGLAGPSLWDAGWFRAAKGIERQVRPRFDWTESTGFDLSWLEYSWMASTFEGPDAFNLLPKLLPRVISIESIPGATCQFRLAAGSSPDSDVKLHNDGARGKELQSALAQFVALANKARYLLEGGHVTGQQSLNLDSNDIAPARSPKGRKGKASN
ncbi:hypothetical protein [Cupriavidus gilardii]|jgi:hypothetical protein|uniref:hypothetical protein n=1 Tax=Cupriavidus gilardii TaxID=82541 RepID=UPI00158123EB|nr:hypothetical protein [Cupriavidus gilardii]MCT9072391.1 hypothetical protein [Cupriavidus gilardii]QKS64022.1 hypothetical protein FOB47_19555 [Cupriavidus gilardii]